MKVGIYVDAANIEANGGYGMRYDVLSRIATLEGGKLLRANTYVVVDRERMNTDDEYARGKAEFFSRLRKCGFKVIEKEIKRYRTETGGERVKANADMDLAIDALVQSVNLDRIYILSGDGDFERLVVALQNRGCRVVCVGFENVSENLVKTADSYYCGFLLPELVPLRLEAGRELGYVSFWDTDRGFGFLNTVKLEGDRLIEEEAYCHITAIEANQQATRFNEGNITRNTLVSYFSEESNDPRYPDRRVAKVVRIEKERIRI